MMRPTIEQELGKMIDERHEMWKAGYEKGLNDAWEVCKKLVILESEDGGYSNSEIKEIFDDKDFTFTKIAEQFTIQEVMAKVKAYEEKKKKLVCGDVVKYTYCDGDKGSCIFLSENKRYYTTLIREFNTPQLLCKELYTLTKTGKHVDLGKLFEGIEE